MGAYSMRDAVQPKREHGQGALTAAVIGAPFNRDQTEVLHISLEMNEAPHIGLWFNYGAWSGANTPPYFNAGVEPTNFPHDDLSVAPRNPGSTLVPSATSYWRLLVSVESPLPQQSQNRASAPAANRISRRVPSGG